MSCHRKLVDEVVLIARFLFSQGLTLKLLAPTTVGARVNP